MRRLLDGIPLDPRSRRAIDETLLDWAAEAARRASGLSRAWTGVCGVAAVSRVLAAALVRDGLATPWGSTAVRFWIVAVPVAFCGVWMTGYFAPLLALPVSAWPEPLAALALASLPAVLPLVVFYVAATWPAGRRVPGVGLLLMVALAVAIVGGLRPVVFGHVLHVWEQHGTPGIESGLASVLASMPITTAAVLGALLGVVPFCAVWLAGGAALRRRTAPRRRSLYVIAPVLFVLSTVVPSLLQVWLLPRWVWIEAPLIAVALMQVPPYTGALVLVWLARRGADRDDLVTAAS
ncbi:MAG: hypothetical protein R2752_10160 [Vicinamibacterales bacterium]